MNMWATSLCLVEIEQLHAFSLHESTFPGDTLAHHVANSLVEKGFATRKNGNFVITEKGKTFLTKIKGIVK